MIEKDTIRLLRECDAGAKMGVSSIDDVLSFVHAQPLSRCLSESRREHEELSRQIRAHLDRFGDEGKDPNPIAEGMSWLKTNMTLGMHDSDHTIADLMTDGCNMGVKSLSRYLNEYQAADEQSKDLAKRLIRAEQQLADDVRPYL